MDSNSIDEVPWGSGRDFSSSERIKSLENDLEELLPWAYMAVEENKGSSSEAASIHKKIEEKHFGVLVTQQAKNKKEKLKNLKNNI